MIIVYVQHFLNMRGMEYFNDHWFPRVKHALENQNGYISITTKTEPTDSECIHIILQFDNHENLQHWVNTPLHNSLIHLLDTYRTKAWLWPITETDKVVSETTDNLTALNWNRVPL